jgi:hypothetical protein
VGFDGFGDGDGFSALAFAFVGGFHKGKHFDGFFGAHGGDFGLEEFDDFLDEGGVGS